MLSASLSALALDAYASASTRRLDVYAKPEHDGMSVMAFCGDDAHLGCVSKFVTRPVADFRLCVAKDSIKTLTAMFPPPKKKKRPGAKRRRSRLVLGLCLLCLLVVVIVSVVLVRCSAEEEGPAEADFGTPAAAWQKNDLGYYFNTSGRAMPAAVLKGMDVSKFQGEIDWEKAKAAGIDFAIIRCGFGGEWDGQEENWAQDDPQWRRNADECTRLGDRKSTRLNSSHT